MCLESVDVQNFAMRASAKMCVCDVRSGAT